ncbi:hypothetical protein SAPIO_CDS3836 [Scedosporium apiospermum]|uniref:Uncharacterized protein n=1 Tax=Pseudallescheria apiosperma TaxID=563466 RepID=A0A084G9S1_PSEDA|nr:uncharacterized protein SAPIO_CDS3836 [Scedosporium apiospermum]KEZ44083.1 hypothetical protein SAPIO_CDS3836 [Scedosporium apiospermum]
MNFGGPKGEKLAQPNRIVVQFCPFERLPVGFGFAYDDGSEVFYGSRSITATADNQRGCEQAPSLRGFKLTTNASAQCVFAMPHQDMEAIEFPSQFETFATFQFTSDKPLIGFLTEIKGFDGELTAIAVVCPQDPVPATLAVTEPAFASATAVPLSLPHSAAIPVTQENLFETRYLAVTNSCVTGATTRDVRRIKFSSGAEGRSRPPDSVSGLLFQYENPLQDRYVGQWFNEVDSLDLDEGDYVAHIKDGGYL